MDSIVNMYTTLFPVIISGILNMAFCKYKVLKFLDLPIDSGKKILDGNRIFGDNKTWKGLFGYIFINMMIYTIWGEISKNIKFLEECNYFYINYENSLIYNMNIGILLGFAYAIFELPNSFIKRRFKISSGKTSDNNFKYLFVFFDQIDSIIGCSLVVWKFYDIGINIFIGFIFIGGLTHIMVNMILYSLKLRKTMI